MAFLFVPIYLDLFFPLSIAPLDWCPAARQWILLASVPEDVNRRGACKAKGRCGTQDRVFIISYPMISYPEYDGAVWEEGYTGSGPTPGSASASASASGRGVPGLRRMGGALPRHLKVFCSCPLALVISAVLVDFSLGVVLCIKVHVDGAY